MTTNPEDKRTGRLDGRKESGRLAEEAGARYLQEQGYVLLKRNWRCRSGEIDIIAKKEGVIIIVEVRSRSVHSKKYGTPAESVTPRKMKQIRETAIVYLQQTNQLNEIIRFDVMGVRMEQNEVVKIEHIVNAF
ncbi:YraN family protein [Paenibacillus bouchesdurhonensis]|uniref:YraN family protein n=1 Tax=Paenibacillus bouchesdurhonensis TaxID=1870990 RepID=UPI000DA633F5|nr:YraN family protein [Paenibacillus bouchesdurhonensis]